MDDNKMDTVTVLLVDDNRTFLHIVKRFLQRQGSVIIAGAVDGGKDALTQAQGLQPDVVVIDLFMPDLPGLKAIPRLRVAMPEVGIVAMTQLDVAGYKEAALAAGADDFVSKSALATDLLPAIWRTVQVRRHKNETGLQQVMTNVATGDDLRQRRSERSAQRYVAIPA